MGFGKSLKKAGKKLKSGVKKTIGKKAYKYGNAIFGPESWKTGAMIGAGAGMAGLLGGGAAAATGAGAAGIPLADAGGGAGGMSLTSLAGPAIGVVGNIASSFISAEGERDANEAGLQSAREQMAFQERMSNTAHQREVKDLEAAGLNPALSANSGASTPVGASADFENAAPNLAPAISSAIEVRRLNKELELAESTIKLNKATARKTNSEAKWTEVQTPLEEKKQNLWNNIWSRMKDLYQGSAKSLNEDENKKRNKIKFYVPGDGQPMWR